MYYESYIGSEIAKLETPIAERKAALNWLRLRLLGLDRG